MTDDWTLHGESIAAKTSTSKRGEAWRLIAAKRLGQMHQAYGQAPEGVTCKTCVFLIHYKQSKTWLKCAKARRSSCDATDWRAGWRACGAHRKET